MFKRLTLCVVMAAAGGMNVPAQAQAPQKIDFILNWVPGGDHAPYYYAKKLGWYAKAKLGTTFKWELKALGYDDEFIDEFTRNLLLHLSR